MNIYSINNYPQNIYSRRNTGYAAVPQVNFHGSISKVLTKDVVSITKKFEELSPKEQRQTLFETFNNSAHFSFETLRNLMKFKDKSIPLIKEFYDITKNDGVFCEGLAFYDLDEEDLPARIEFYKKYKEISPDETIRHDVNMLYAVNRYNLPLVELMGIKANYNDAEIKLVQNTRTKEDADAKTEAWKLLSKTLEDGEYAYGYDKQERIAILNLTDKDNLPLLKKFCEHEEFYTLDYNDIKKAMESANKDNIEYKLKIFDLTDSLSDFNLDVVDCTNENNYPLVEYLVNDDDFPWDSISKVAENVKKKDCKSKIEIYESINKSKKSNFNWVSTTNIMYRTNRYNIDFAKTLVKDENITPKNIDYLLSFAPSKELKDIKFYAYNHLKDRKDVKNNPKAFVQAIKCTDDECMNIFNALVQNPNFNIENIADILVHNISNNEEEALFLKLINETPGGMTGTDVQNIADVIVSNNRKIVEKICFDEKFSTEEKIKFLESTILTRREFQNINNFMCELDLQKPYDNYKKMRQTALNNPEIYINGDDSDGCQGMIDYINNFFDEHMSSIVCAAYIFDLKTLDDLFRMRFDFAEDYLDDFINLSKEDLTLLKSLCDSKNIDGTSISSKQKIEMLNLMQAYKDNNTSLNKMYEMAEKGIINVYELNEDLLNKIFKNLEINIENISKKKLHSWDLRYIHLLAQELEDSDWDNKKLFKTVINAANSEKSFKDFIQDPTNEYGYNNKATMLDFKELKMNYDKWVNPDKKNNVHFVHKDENKEKLSQISKQIEEDINTLLHSMDEVVKSYDKNPIRKILYNSFGEYMVKEGYGETSDRFVIPAKIRESKANLTKLVEALSETRSRESAMSAFWNRAMANLNNPQKEKQARKTLMFLNHLTQRLDDLEETDKVKTRNLDLTIKMWDRIPQKDLFQGNYSTCCIGMNETNGWSMPVYLLNTAFNMIELVDNNTGETVGNALCYFLRSYDNEVVFIIDNIEIRNSVKPSDEVGKKLRSAITKYAKNISKDITGRDDIQILLGTKYNDVPVEDLKKSYSFIKTLGKELRNEVYIDAIDYTKVAVIGESLYKLM